MSHFVGVWHHGKADVAGGIVDGGIVPLTPIHLARSAVALPTAIGEVGIQAGVDLVDLGKGKLCLLYTSPSPRD